MLCRSLGGGDLRREIRFGEGGVESRQQETEMSLDPYWLVVPLIIGLAVCLVLWLMRP